MPDRPKATFADCGTSKAKSVTMTYLGGGGKNAATKARFVIAFAGEKRQQAIFGNPRYYRERSEVHSMSDDVQSTPKGVSLYRRNRR